MPDAAGLGFEISVLLTTQTITTTAISATSEVRTRRFVKASRTDPSPADALPSPTSYKSKASPAVAAGQATLAAEGAVAARSAWCDLADDVSRRSVSAARTDPWYQPRRPGSLRGTPSKGVECRYRLCVPGCRPRPKPHRRARTRSR